MIKVYLHSRGRVAEGGADKAGNHTQQDTTTCKSLM